MEIYSSKVWNFLLFFYCHNNNPSEKIYTWMNLYVWKANIVVGTDDDELLEQQSKNAQFILKA